MSKELVDDALEYTRPEPVGWIASRTPVTRRLDLVPDHPELARWL